MMMKVLFPFKDTTAHGYKEVDDNLQALSKPFEVFNFQCAVTSRAHCMDAHCTSDLVNVKINLSDILVCALCFPTGQPCVCCGEDGRADGGQWAQTQC